jgi:pyruvate dehydrogenase E2 component (dihydrolipoamide acetyltransferase)
MATKVEMPKLSDTMEEGVIGKWNVKEGDTVESGDIIAEVETDKATMEVEVFDAGTILKILVDEGDTVPLGELMAVIGEEGEDISDITGGGEAEVEVEDEDEVEVESEDDDSGEDSVDEQQKDEEKSEVEEEEDKDKEASEEKKDEAEKDEVKDKAEADDEEDDGKLKKPGSDKKQKSTNGKQGSENGRVKASPLARKMAEEQGIELSKVQGSGPEGRIIKKDIEEYEPAAEPGMETSREDTEHRVSQMRKTIARRLAESKYSSPHYYETIDIDVEQMFEARKQLNESIEGKISFNDIIIKACSAALRKHPMVNSSWQDDTILEHGDINVAFAVAIDEGLLTPVIRNSDQKGLQQIGEESKDLAEKARNRKLEPEQMEGSTFTISNLGMFGIEQFTAIINPPNACILAVGAIRDVPVVKEGVVAPGKRMKVTLSSDHRIVDGATAAQFLNTLNNMLQNPLGILL